MPPRVNLRSSAVKRIMQEAAEKSDPDTDGFIAAPLETDIFEWHCTVKGVKGTDYEGGLYHVRILLPASYPMSAPDIIFLTPNGRFELGKKICIDGLTSFHAGSWQPAWGVRTAITGLRAFWTQDGEALSAIGALDVSKEERRRLARLSRDWVCSTCGEPNSALLPDTPDVPEAGPSASDAEEPVTSSYLAADEDVAAIALLTEPSTAPATPSRTTETPAEAPPTEEIAAPSDAVEPVPVPTRTTPLPIEQPPIRPATPGQFTAVPARFIRRPPEQQVAVVTGRVTPIWLDLVLAVLCGTVAMLIGSRLM